MKLVDREGLLVSRGSSVEETQLEEVKLQSMDMRKLPE